MRIKRLELLAYGPFTNKSLDLSEGHPGLHVVHGPNEAGKSSALRALKAWLFGIDSRTTDNFVHAYPLLRVGGVLETANGTEIACVRRKGNKDTLLSTETDEPIGDDVLTKLLPGLDENLFAQLHGIDHERLVQGGHAILEQSGDLGKSLFGAALGGKRVNDLLAELTTEADKLFRARGHNQIINAAATKLREARREERQLLVSVRAWKELRKSLKEVEEAITGIEERTAVARREKSRLERFRRVAGPLAERRDLIERRKVLGEVVLLTEDFGSRRQQALGTLSVAIERLQKAEGKLKRAQMEANELDVPEGLLDNQVAIEELQLLLGAHQKAVKDKPALDAKRRDHRKAAQDILSGIRPDLSLESVVELKPLLNRKKMIGNLAQEVRLLNQKTVQLDARLRELSDERTELQHELEGMTGPSKDVASLRVAVQAARNEGNLPKMLQKARHAVNQQEQTCSQELSRLGRFDGSLDVLARRPMPEKSVLDGFERILDGLSAQSQDTVRRQSEVRQELEKFEEELKSLLRSSDVPSFDELKVARDNRDHGWMLVRSIYVDGVGAGSDGLNHAGDQDLPSAYEQAVAVADNIADRLRLHAQQVQVRAQLETQIQARTHKLSGLEDSLREQANELERQELAWQKVWKGIVGSVGTPKEMKEWLQRVEQLLEKNEHLERLKAEVNSLDETQNAHARNLASELKRIGIQEKSKAQELDALLARCEQVLDQQENASRRKGELEASLRKLDHQIKIATDERRQVGDQLTQWKISWRDAVEGLGLGTNPHPDLAIETMEKLEELFGELKEADAAHKRISGMDQDEERFAAAVTQLAQRLSFEVGKQSPADVTQTFARQFAKAQADAASLESHRKRISELEEEIVEAGQDIHLANENLASLRVEAGVSSNEELGPIEDRSEQARNLTARIDSVEQQLHQSGEGYGIEELEEEARILNADNVGDELIRLETMLTDLEGLRDTSRDQRKELLVQIQAIDGSSKAAESAERAEQLLARIVPDAEQYLRLTIARLILEEQMERYRQDNQTPVLKRAGELFARLTLGSFSGLRDEADSSGKPVLLGVRPDRTEVTVEGMSEGTRDQLFLALRLATIDLQSGHGDPLPFVVDDILVGFDDERSTACLDVLAEFAERTQVLLFTHHSMVAQAASELGEGRGVFVHALAG